MLIVGLTGGIATGKSMATAWLRAQGVRVIDMDDVARVVVQPGRPALARIRRRFGDGVLHPDGSLDRAELGKRVFGDASERRALNAIMRVPLTVELLRGLGAALGDGLGVVVIDAPLLFEAGLHRLAAHVIVVATPEGTQLERLIARDGVSREDAMARIVAQLPLATKIARADVIVENGGDRASGLRSLEAAWARVRADAPPCARQLPWLRLPRASSLPASALLWLALCAVRLGIVG
ncbi:hypothetical protein KFE25_001201 [Diacronema lutheri]|uniref:Dephospho-CoA kinase n=2 Tax=Diacronema lutheri TaxID=2081491 RepID=A0A8J5XIA0_DIALT|nr:hypothetical protein KFE25_001201 [Diacronema lutheri]